MRTNWITERPGSSVLTSVDVRFRSSVGVDAQSEHGSREAPNWLRAIQLVASHGRRRRAAPAFPGQQCLAAPLAGEPKPREDALRAGAESNKRGGPTWCEEKIVMGPFIR